jgi:hypothetical protein
MLTLEFLRRFFPRMFQNGHLLPTTNLLRPQK